MGEKKYKRIVIKLSGEALAGEGGFGLDNEKISSVVDQLCDVHRQGIEIGIIVGGGNFWRGRQGDNMDRTTADHMGMLATTINALALQDALEKRGVQTRVQTAITMTRVAEPYILRRAIRHFEKGGSSSSPAAPAPIFPEGALRSAEVHADVLLLAKNIDGVYDSDPKTNKDAIKIKSIKYIDMIKMGLKAMDTTATSMCMENNIPVIVFSLNEKDSIVKAIAGESIGTLIHN